jgi:hypothetical protein
VELGLDFRYLAGFFFTFTTSSAGDWTDLWLVAAAAGVAVFPVPRFRKWLALWVVAVAFAVVRRRGSTLSTFMYPATVFLPLLAVGVAGLVASAAALARSPSPRKLLWATGIGLIAVLAAVSLRGSLGHFRTKIDYWTQRSVADAEQAMAFVNSHTDPDDFVVVPKQIYWLVRNEKKAMLAFCVNYEGQVNEMAPVAVPHDLFWFDCRWQNAKYAVIAAGQDAAGLYGFDAVCTAGLPQIRAALDAIAAGERKWPVAFSTAEYKVFANPRFAGASSR